LNADCRVVEKNSVGLPEKQMATGAALDWKKWTKQLSDNDLDVADDILFTSSSVGRFRFVTPRRFVASWTTAGSAEKRSCTVSPRLTKKMKLKVREKKVLMFPKGG
jgi:hypothetical protein